MIDAILHTSAQRGVRLTAIAYSWRAGREFEMQYAANSVKLSAMVSKELSSLLKRFRVTYCERFHSVPLLECTHGTFYELN